MLANYDLKKSLLHGNAHVLGQPEFFLGSAGSKFNETGALTDEATKGYVDGAWTALVS